MKRAKAGSHSCRLSRSGIDIELSEKALFVGLADISIDIGGGQSQTVADVGLISGEGKNNRVFR